MESDSALYVTSECAANSSYTDSVLIRETSTSRLYRVSREGKHFMFKTARDNSEMLTSLIRREYELSMTLNNPYIAYVFTYDSIPGIGEGIVMEYVDGCSLADFLKENPDLALRRRVLLQLFEAVAYIHRKGIIHNDLKPENIMVTRSDNNVKIIDFGLSDDDAHYLLKTLGCTLEYASPELLRRETLDVRSDIYSLGLLMKDILGNRNAFISSKASRQSPDRRYGNVDALIRAYSRRHMPALVILSIFILTAIIAPYIQIAHTRGIQSEREAFRDSVYRDTEERMLRLYGDLEERLKDIPFREFAYSEMAVAMEGLPAIWQTYTEITADKELISSFMSHYTLLQNDHYQRLIDIIGTKPLISTARLPKEEQDFYQGLFGRSIQAIRTIKDKQRQSARVVFLINFVK